MARLRRRAKADPVRAAGGVVMRSGSSGELEVLLVHRPKYDDWSIPKGKLDRGEKELDAALREVEEETGLRCRAGRELPGISYRDRNGRPKTVRYWEMTPTGGQFEPNHEVDEARWLTVPQAVARLTYDRDRDVLAAVQNLPRL